MTLLAIHGGLWFLLGAFVGGGFLFVLGTALAMSKVVELEQTILDMREARRRELVGPFDQERDGDIPLVRVRSNGHRPGGQR